MPNAPLMRGPSRTETPSSRICTQSFTGTKNTALAQSAQLALELILDELEIEHAAEAPAKDVPSDVEETKPPRTPRTRKPLPKGLKRVQKTIIPSDACEACGGGAEICPKPLHREPNRPATNDLIIGGAQLSLGGINVTY